jgi:hypothetical protein
MLILTGNGQLTRDVELREIRSGKQVASVLVASNRRDRRGDRGSIANSRRSSGPMLASRSCSCASARSAASIRPVWARCDPSKARMQAWRDSGGDPNERPKPFYKLEAVFS